MSCRWHLLRTRVVRITLFIVGPQINAETSILYDPGYCGHNIYNIQIMMQRNRTDNFSIDGTTVSTEMFANRPKVPVVLRSCVRPHTLSQLCNV